jgi:hypothetical protein
MSLPGLLRHVRRQDPEERESVNACKVPVEEHLRRLMADGRPLLEENGAPRRRVIAVSARSVGNNHGVVAWQKDQTPRFFHVRGDPLNFASYSCLTVDTAGRLAIRDLRFDGDRVLEGSADISDEIRWCTYGNPVLRGGQVARVEDIIDQFADIRHVLAFERELPLGQQIEEQIFAGYPSSFRENALRALRAGVPRQRFLHHCIGLSEEHVIILQREGTIEEVAHWLREAGAQDGLILDNGASPFCWAWWLYPNGGFLFTAPDYRPRASAIIAFVLHGPVKTDLPTGSVGFTVI